MLIPHRPKVLLLIPHLGGGGSERVIETLARSLNSAKYEVHLALVTATQTAPRFFPSAVSIHELRSSRVRCSALKLLKLIWGLKPSLILSGISHLNLLVLALRPLLPRNTRILVRQNGALQATLAPHSRLLSRRAYSLTYRRADRVICQTESMAHEIHRALAVALSKLLVLPNPTDIRHIRAASASNPKQATTSATLLCIGRLVPEKGFDILLDAFAALSLPFRSTKLIIVGSGPEKSRLHSQAEALGVIDRVHFSGQVPDPVLQFPHASAFVLSSRTEGLPNALLEAAAAGLPIVAMPAFSGASHLLANREGVWLAAEISSVALRSALEEALGSIQPCTRYRHAWIEPYDLLCAITAYEAALDRVIAEAAS
jgi:glycosyltransferase involved in cell wall biosynthesis